MYQTTHGRHAMPLDTARDAHEGMRQGRPSNNKEKCRMTTTTTRRLTGADIGAALHSLAAVFDTADTLAPELLERLDPEQGEQFMVLLASADAVRAVAARFDVEVDQYAASPGVVHTTAEVGFGAGTDPHGRGSYAHAVVARFVHLTDEVA